MNNNRIKNWLMDNVLSLLPDSLFLRLKYLKVMHRYLRLNHPVTFNEKLQWLKINNRDPLYTELVDKLSVKQVVSKIIGEEYIIKTLGVWEHPEEIEWDSLPSQFVLKTTNGGGNTGIIICHNKDTFDKGKAIEKLRESLNIDLYKRFREWPYKDIHKRIIAEEYIDGGESELMDYKFMCYNGVCKHLFVCSNRSVELAVDFFDLTWTHLPFTRCHPNRKNIPKPKSFDTMVNLVNKLAKLINSPFVRIDLYNVDGKIYFGEVTFFPGGGMEAFDPEEWDNKLGEMIKLPIDG